MRQILKLIVVIIIIIIVVVVVVLVIFAVPIVKRERLRHGVDHPSTIDLFAMHVDCTRYAFALKLGNVNECIVNTYFYSLFILETSWT